jgi:hypothetical protein
MTASNNRPPLLIAFAMLASAHRIEPGLPILVVRDIRVAVIDRSAHASRRRHATFLLEQPCPSSSSKIFPKASNSIAQR